MVFETKFNCGDMVWFMFNNKPYEVKISRIYIQYNPNPNDFQYNHLKIQYRIKFIHSTNCEADQWFDESTFFKTKKELIESL